MEDQNLDLQVRVSAMQLAIKAAETIPEGVDTPEDLVRCAHTFYTFLVGAKK